ncbi:MAG: hypothetical protein ABDH18_02960 [Aquificaceae bacterium]
MRKNLPNLKSVGTFFLYLALFLILFIALILPKFIIFDKILQKNGLYLIASSVKETPISITLKDTIIYTQSSALVRFDTLNVSLRPSGITLAGSCEGGSLKIHIKPSGIKSLNARDFKCLYQKGALRARLEFKKDGIMGQMSLEKFQAGSYKVEKLEIDFKNRVFVARAKLAGIELQGDGQAVFNAKDPLQSSLNGQLIAPGFRLIISGPLRSLNFSQ